MNETPPSNGTNRVPESSGSSGAPSPSDGTGQMNARERQTRQWAMFIHFSLLAGWIVPLAGLIVPILLWQMKKDELPGIVPHAHIVLNWIVTSLVYALICFILVFVLIGIPALIVLGIVTVIFSIVGGIKANEGEVWEYPGTLIKPFK